MEFSGEVAMVADNRGIRRYLGANWSGNGRGAEGAPEQRKNQQKQASKIDNLDGKRSRRKESNDSILHEDFKVAAIS
uniref:Uncharacterized protein n=1 Tax=Pristionchus pacificus TaxID=54126 RepID=A0A2A6CTU6_PRIPA|eukprot:PDM81461.1 hypothetical protein PRIPAC_35337 [Pristionchus pacificus]